MATVAFKDLNKLASHSRRENTRKELFQKLYDKPFWIWDKQQHKQEDIKTNGECYFNHIIGLPQKDGTDKPLLDYEQIIFDYLVTQNDNNNKHLWINKVTGLGVSEFMLRFIAWLCLKDDKLAGSQMAIVTAPRIELTIDDEYHRHTQRDAQAVVAKIKRVGGQYAIYPC